MTARIDTWSPFAGPHGGTGWRNLCTGEIRYGSQLPPEAAMFAERPSRPPPSQSDIDQVEQLLDRARRETVGKIIRLGAGALRRLLAADINAALFAREFFTSEERTQLGQTLLRLLTPAELLGRARIRLRQIHRCGPTEPTPFDLFRIQRFDEVSGVRPLAPEAAIDYFKGLLPILRLDPLDIAPPLERRAFTLAVTTDDVILRRVHAVILDRLETGKEVSQAPAVIQEILARAGIHPRNPNYAEMVCRTNMLESYRNGAWREFQDPDIAVDFPVWRYIGIHDGRERHGDDPQKHQPAPVERPDHLRWFDQHFARGVAFADVRGTDIADVANCRCDFIPIYKADWTKLQAKGVATIDNWQQIKALDQYTEWVPYVGPREGRGWLNTTTGIPVYTKDRPGSHEHIASEREAGHSWDKISRATGIPVTTLRSRFRAARRIREGQPATLKARKPNLAAHEARIVREMQTDENRLQWSARAEEAGVDPNALHQMAHEMIRHEESVNVELRNMLATARAINPHLSGPAWNKLIADGGDQDSIPEFDDLSRSLAERYPQFLGDHGYKAGVYDARATEAEERLFEYLKAGDPPPPDEEDIYYKALDHLYVQTKRSQSSPAEEDVVPFTELWLPSAQGFAESWSPYTGPKGGRGWRNNATGEVLYQTEKPEEAAKQGRPQGSGLYGRGSEWAMKFRAIMFQMHQNPGHGKTEEWSNHVRDRLVEAYKTSVNRRIRAIDHQIKERHGVGALDTEHWKTFMRATAPNRTPFEDEFKALAHDMAAAAVEHSKSLTSYADGMDRRRELHEKLREHERKLSRAAAQHADALDKAHVTLVKALREHYANADNKTTSMATSIPQTHAEAEKIANRIRDHIEDSDGNCESGDCLTAAGIISQMYPNAVPYMGIYHAGDDSGGHVIMKVGEFFIDVTADQFGGDKIAVFKEEVLDPFNKAHDQELSEIYGHFRPMTHKRDTSEHAKVAKHLSDSMQGTSDGK